MSKDPKNLTESQTQILSYITRRFRQNGISPSFREIQEHFGYRAVGTVQDHIKALIKKGVIEKAKAGQARSLVPAKFTQEEVRKVPIYGEIAAGSTRETEQIEIGTLYARVTEVREPCFALRVTGNSMIDAGIFEGDYLLVEQEVTVRNGDIVVALVNGETTVKRYEKKGKEVLLHPENATMKPIRVSVAQSFSIQGKVVGLHRKL